jgi:hypothetical protein
MGLLYLYTSSLSLNNCISRARMTHFEQRPDDGGFERVALGCTWPPIGWLPGIIALEVR